MEMTQSNNRPKGIEQALPADYTDNGLFGQDILSVRQFNRDLLQYVCDVSDEMRSMVQRSEKSTCWTARSWGICFTNPVHEPAHPSRQRCCGWAGV